MKKILSLLLCLVMILSLTTAVSAATGDPAATGGDEVCIYVYLSGDDAEYTYGVEYAKGAVPVRPEDPGKTGLTFVDWYTDRGYMNRFDFTQPLYEDVEIFGRFASPEDVIGINVFDSPSADYPLYGYLLVKRDYAEYQNAPEVAEDEEFVGWYTDRALTNEFDFSQPVYDYTYLFPRIVKEDDVCWGALYLDASDEYPISYTMVVRGELCSVPADPGKDGKRFVGWYNDRALKKPMDFTKPCYEDFDLFAKWEDACTHPHLLDGFVEGYAATATTDGMRDYWKCPKCGKYFIKFGSRLVEANYPDDMIIDATGPYLLGDADGDGEVSSIDVTLIQRKMADMDISGGFCRKAADVDRNDEIEIIDGTYIQRHLAMMETPYLIGVETYPIT